MQNINHVFVAGNLTRDPELRSTTSGKAVLSLGIAVNDSRKNQQGQWEDRPNFFDCVVFGRQAESLANLLHKGMKVTIAGKLRQTTWEKDGQKRSKVEIVAEEVELPPKPQGQQTPQQPSYGAQAQQTANYANNGYSGAQAGAQSAYDYYPEDLPY